MAAQVGALRVTVGADISPLQTGMRRAERQVSRSAGVMSRAVKDVNTSLTGLGSIAGVTLGGAGLLAGAAAFIKVADAAKSLQAQLKLATSEYGSLAKANQDVRNIAEQTRSDLLATAELYASLQRNSGQLGTTQEQVARATQTVAQAFKISGAATSEQANATRQLIQAFQSGVLRGDEFNSIMENAPRLAKLLADSLGVTTGALRKMAEEGELTADKLVRAFTDTRFTESIDAEFRQLPVTFDEAMGQVYNAAVIVFSEFDRGGQFSTSLANFVTDGSEGFSQLGKSAYNFGQSVRDTFTAIDEIRQALASLQSDGILGFFNLENATYGWRDALADTLGVLDGVINQVSNLANLPGNAIRVGVLGWEPIVDPSDMRGGFLRESNKQRVDASRQQIFGRSLNDVFSEFGMERKPPPFRAPPKKARKGGGAKKAPRDRSDDVEFQFAQELRQAQMDVLRAQQSMAVTNEERARIALLLLDAERQGQEAELADRVRRAERDFAEKKITVGALEQVKVQAERLRAEYNSRDALERKAVADELAAQKASDAAALVESDFDIQIEKAQLEASLLDTATERRAAELRILALMKEQERARLETVIADQDSSELAKEEARRRLASLDEIYAGRADSIRQGTRGPMEDWLAQLPTTAARAQEAFEQLQIQGFEGLIDAALALSEGFDSAKDALLGTLKQFLIGLARMELQKLAGSLIGGGFKLPGFATGGSFLVRGFPGVDRNVMSIGGLPVARVSYGERVSISNDNDRGRMGRGGDTIVNVNGVRDFDSFRRNERQVARTTRRALGID